MMRHLILVLVFNLQILLIVNAQEGLSFDGCHSGYVLQNDACEPCKPGEYDANIKDEEGVEQCIKCPEGFTSEKASESCTEEVQTTEVQPAGEFSEQPTEVQPTEVQPTEVQTTKVQTAGKTASPFPTSWDIMGGLITAPGEEWSDGSELSDGSESSDGSEWNGADERNDSSEWSQWSDGERDATPSPTSFLQAEIFAPPYWLSSKETPDGKVPVQHRLGVPLHLLLNKDQSVFVINFENSEGSIVVENPGDVEIYAPVDCDSTVLFRDETSLGDTEMYSNMMILKTDDSIELYFDGSLSYALQIRDADCSLGENTTMLLDEFDGLAFSRPGDSGDFIDEDGPDLLLGTNDGWKLGVYESTSSFPGWITTTSAEVKQGDWVITYGDYNDAVFLNDDDETKYYSYISAVEKAKICESAEMILLPNNTCATCPDNSYSNRTRNNHGWLECVECEDGYVVDNGKCAEAPGCPAGQGAGEDGECTDCQAYSYSGEDDDVCSACVSGTYSGVRASNCITAGTFVDVTSELYELEEESSIEYYMETVSSWPHVLNFTVDWDTTIEEECYLEILINDDLDFQWAINRNLKGILSRTLHYDFQEGSDNRQMRRRYLPDSSSFVLSTKFGYNGGDPQFTAYINDLPLEAKNPRDRSMDLNNRITVKITQAPSKCLTFVPDRSYVISGDKQIPETDAMTAPPTGSFSVATVTPTDSSERRARLKIELCPERYFYNCELLVIKENDKMIVEEEGYLSIKTEVIEDGYALELEFNNEEKHNISHRLFDSDITDGHTQRGFNMIQNAETSLVALRLVKEDEQEAITEPTPTTGPATEPQKKTTEPLNVQFLTKSAVEVVQKNFTVEDIDDIGMKETLFNNSVSFETKEDNGEEPNQENLEVKVWKASLGNNTIPVEKMQEKSEEYATDRSNKNIMGFFAYNGYIEVGAVKSELKKKKKARGKDTGKSEEEDEEEDRRDEEETTMGYEIDEDGLVETVKAFQRFNGYPETGELTEDQYTDALETPRCGNHDTSYREEIGTYKCKEGRPQATDQRTCTLKTKYEYSIMFDICALYPSMMDLKEDKKFVWNNGYYFEIDVDFKNSKRDASHIFLAFNYVQKSGKADFLMIRHNRKKQSLCPSWGSYAAGKRTTTGSGTCLQFNYQVDEPSSNKHMRKQMQFKLKLLVKSDGETRLSVNGRRRLIFQSSMPVKSSVFAFTLAGGHFRDHNVKILTSRICRRNPEHGTFLSRKKRYELTNYRWELPETSLHQTIKYTIINHSTMFSSPNTIEDVQQTRMEIIKAINAYESIGLSFEELDPKTAAQKAHIVIMFFKDQLHADGRFFNGLGIEKAHAFSPVHGEIHINDYQHYSLSLDTKRSTSLFYIVLHELGHALGIKHSTEQEAVMTSEYAETAFEIDSLDLDDIEAIRDHYRGDIDAIASRHKQSCVAGQPCDSVFPDYEQRTPVPKACVKNIEAAFYFYDAEQMFLIGNGYVWVFNNNKVMLKGYPKRTSEVFRHAHGRIESAFQVFNYIVLSTGTGKKVYMYKVEEYRAGVYNFMFHKETTFDGLYEISDKKILAAFVTEKKRRQVKITLVVSETKRYIVTWKKGDDDSPSGLMVVNDNSHIDGAPLAEHEWGAAFEYKEESSARVMVLGGTDAGKTAYTRRIPGTEGPVLTGIVDVRTQFGIIGMCYL